MNSINGQLIELTVDSMWLPFPADLVTGLTAEADFSGIPRNAVVVSNGEVRRIGRRVHVSVRRKGDLALIASPALKQLREGRFQFHAPDPSAAAVQVYRRSGPEALAMMEQILGPIPGNHVRVTVVDRESVAGYNRPGYIVVPSRKPDTEPASLAMSLAHEIAHSWFSKANFMTEDFWLIEAPADYLAHRYGEETLGTDVVRPFLQKAQRRAEKSGSVLGRGRPNDDAAYGRGNMLLRSLEHRIGKPAIDGFLREFAALDEHTTRSFLDLLAARQGGALAAEFEASLRAKDYRPLSPRENPPPA